MSSKRRAAGGSQHRRHTNQSMCDAWVDYDRKPSLLPFSFATRMRFWRILGPVPEKSQKAVIA